jgi:hypothetical protein
MAGKQGNRGTNTPALTKLDVLLIIIDKLFTAKHRTTRWDLAGFVSANAAMYALLFLVACNACGFTMDAGVLAALVAGTFAFSTPYYVRIALGRRGAQDEQDKDTDETGAGDS